MNKAQMNLQDNFLNQVRKDNIPVTIYLVSGVQLKGNVRGFDSFTIVLESPGKPAQLVYKHAMASVVPARPVTTSGGPRDDRQPEPQQQAEQAPQPEPPQPDPPEEPEQAPQPDPPQPDPPEE